MNERGELTVGEAGDGEAGYIWMEERRGGRRRWVPRHGARGVVAFGRHLLATTGVALQLEEDGQREAVESIEC
jgi:uncharacterized iron-regulated membrane protein